MNDRAIIQSFEKSWAQRLVIVGLAMVVGGLLIWVGVGFRGRHIARSAAALTPVTLPTSPTTTTLPPAR
jgi:hypothetical protein